MLTNLLKCGCCRNAAYYALPFCAGVVAVGAPWTWVAGGVAFWFVFNLATELSNRVSDRVEDAVNRRERTSLCEGVGFGRLESLAKGAWATLFSFAAVWVIVDFHPLLVLILAFVLTGGVNYSDGVRLKRNVFWSNLALAFPFAGTFAMGAAAFAATNGLPIVQTILDVLPATAVLGLTTASLAGIKDITDVEGDRRIGFEGIWVALSSNGSFAAALLLVTAPFAVLAAEVALGMLPARFLIALLLLVPTYLLVLGVFRAREPEERLAVRELMYQFRFVLVAALLLLFAPTRPVGAIVGVGAVYWGLASQLLHWNEGLRWRKVTVFLGLLRSAGGVRSYGVGSRS